MIYLNIWKTKWASLSGYFILKWTHGTLIKYFILIKVKLKIVNLFQNLGLDAVKIHKEWWHFHKSAQLSAETQLIGAQRRIHRLQSNHKVIIWKKTVQHSLLSSFIGDQIGLITQSWNHGSPKCFWLSVAVFHSGESDVAAFGLEVVPADWPNFTVGAGQKLDVAHRVGKSDVLKMEHVGNHPEMLH